MTESVKFYSLKISKLFFSEKNLSYAIQKIILNYDSTNLSTMI